MSDYPERGSRWRVRFRHNRVTLPIVLVEVLDSGHGTVVIVRRDIEGKYPVAISIVEWDAMQPVKEPS